MPGVELTDAFPVSMRSDVEVAVRALPEATLPAGDSDQPMLVDGEKILIPYRIYNPEPATLTLESLTPQRRAVLRCLLSRHHDGRVRLRHGTAVVHSGAPFSIPFVVLLAGDYIAEIVEMVQAGLTDLTDRSSETFRLYGRFLNENPSALSLLSRRTISFWNEHYRKTIPRAEYPGFKLVEAFEKAAEHKPRSPN